MWLYVSDQLLIKNVFWLFQHLAFTMEQFVLNVRTMSGQGNFHELSDFLAKSMDMLDRNSGQLANVLETLDIQQHSLGVLAVSFYYKFN